MIYTNYHIFSVFNCQYMLNNSIYCLSNQIQICELYYETCQLSNLISLTLIVSLITDIFLMLFDLALKQILKLCNYTTNLQYYVKFLTQVFIICACLLSIAILVKMNQSKLDMNNSLLGTYIAIIFLAILKIIFSFRLNKPNQIPKQVLEQNDNKKLSNKSDTMLIGEIQTSTPTTSRNQTRPSFQSQINI
ncbi:hypothetical protein pb186bvf_015641 [Paramecium bursaria]